MKGLAISQVAERTGIAAGTIRMWEQRYGFPEPARTRSGYRVYTEEDVDVLRRVAGFRERGLSVPAALERARAASGPTDRPSLYGAIATGDEPVASCVLHKSSLLAISLGDALRDEWAVIIDAPGYAACLLAWETPESQADAELPDRQRSFEAIWTTDARTVRRAALTGAALAGRRAPALGERVEALLHERPLAFEAPAPGLTALTNRMLGYLDEQPAAGPRGSPSP